MPASGSGQYQSFFLKAEQLALWFIIQLYSGCWLSELFQTAHFRFHTTTNFTAEEIHGLGLREVDQDIKYQNIKHQIWRYWVRWIQIQILAVPISCKLTKHKLPKLWILKCHNIVGQLIVDNYLYYWIQVSNIEAEMQTVIAELGPENYFGPITVKEFMDKVRNDPENYFG